MSRLIVQAAGFYVCLLAGASSGIADDAERSNRDHPAVAADQLAERIFTAADRNHNHVLNKIEFANARSLLAAEVEQLGRQGLLGQPRKGKQAKSDHQVAAVSDATAAGDKLARSNKVSPAEFAFFVHAVVDETDEKWRQMHAAADAQRKAVNAQRRAMGARRAAGVYRYPY